MSREAAKYLITPSKFYLEKVKDYDHCWHPAGDYPFVEGVGEAG